ncbi:MAG TPA: MdtA/MuxA family multidrug efflux RND transporter periplasmic adaptor subunit [Terriglobales bacterium]|nr:MdtA/MuxA family multidrug efflux RND transporter periplasmic adaptor subunit [Terriglobales bacterium]
METSKLRTFALAVLSLASAVGLGCGASASRPTTARAAYTQAVPVGVATVQQRDMPVYLVGLGTVTPLYSVNVKSRVDGELVQVNFKEGQHVKKGELLAVIDPRPYEVALSQAEAQKFKDQASLRDAKLNYQRYKDLLNQSGAMSQQQVDTQLATADQLEGAVRADQAAIDNAKLQLTYCHITSPIEGRVGLRLVDPGNMVHTTDANPMLVITQLQPITVIFTLPEDQLNSVRQHMRNAMLEADAYSRDDQTRISTGKLLTIDNQIDVTTGTGRLKAEFANPGDELWPNQFVNIHLLLETRKNSLVIPAAAVQRGPQGTYVFVVKADKTVEVRPITVAISQNNLTAVSSGLSADETVVTDGQDKLQAGSKVEPRGAGRPVIAPPGGQPAPQQAGRPGL